MCIRGDLFSPPLLWEGRGVVRYIELRLLGVCMRGDLFSPPILWEGRGVVR